MGYFRVEANSSLPPASAEWKVDLGDDPKQSLLYANLGYDLVAAAMAKLGVEYSKFLVGDQTEEQLETNMNKVFDALRPGAV
jgi:hypothetical protein